MIEITLKTQLGSLLILVTATLLNLNSVHAGNRTVTEREAYKAVSNRLEQIEGPRENYQVWVGVVPMSEYLRDTSQFRVFSDVEIKFSIGHLFKNKTLSTGEIITTMQFKLLCATFNMDISLYLDPMTNNAVAFYFENRSTQSLKRVELEKYDSLLEVLAKEYYEHGHDFNGDQYHTALYCVVDGRVVDPEMKWFYAGNGTLEVHVARCAGTKVERNSGKAAWWPLQGRWFNEVPEWLHVPPKSEIDYVRDGTTPFWDYIRNR